MHSKSLVLQVTFMQIIKYVRRPTSKFRVEIAQHFILNENMERSFASKNIKSSEKLYSIYGDLI